MDNPEVKETTAIYLRKYLTEAVIIVLASAVVSLSLMYNSLNTFIRETMTKQLIEQARVIERNTDAFNTFIIHSNQNQR